MSVSTPILSGLLTKGTHTFGPVAVPIGVVTAEAQIDRTQMTSPTLQVDWNFELSIDAGATWISWGGAGSVGGMLKDEFDTIITFSSFSIGFLVVTGMNMEGSTYTRVGASVVRPNEMITPGFEPTNVNRRLRGQITVNEDVMSTLTVLLNMMDPL